MGSCKKNYITEIIGSTITLTIGSLRITLLTRFVPQIDQTQRTQQAQQIITSDYFQTIKKQRLLLERKGYNMSKSNELQKYFEAGWNLNFSENPPYASSPIGLAFAAGVWARKHSLPCGEIKSSRGYKMIVNRDYILDFKDSDCNPNVTKKQTVV